MKVVTHNGVFHTDDVVACAALSLIFDIEITRTRNSVQIESADIAVDVGGEYNPDHNRFDHHQKGGAGTRENGVPFASAGLVWLHYGDEICRKVLEMELSTSIIEKISDLVDKSLIMGIDARDNGMKTHYGINNAEVYSISDLITAFNPNWYSVQNFGTFFTAVDMAKIFLANEIRRQAGAVLAEAEVVKMVDPQKERQVVVLEKYVPWSNTVPELYPKVLYVAFPDPTGEWRIQATSMGSGAKSFELKAPFPADWRGKTHAELKFLTNCSDVVFCHNGGFIMGTKTREGALQCAELALQIHLKAKEMR